MKCDKAREVQKIADAIVAAVGEQSEMLFLKYESIVQGNIACQSSGVYAKLYQALASDRSSLAAFAQYKMLFGESAPNRELTRLFQDKYQKDVAVNPLPEKLRPAEYVRQYKVLSAQLEENLEKFCLSFLMMGFMKSSNSEFFFHFVENPFVLEMWKRQSDRLVNILEKVMKAIGEKINPQDAQGNVLIATYNLMKLYAAARSHGKALDVRDVKPYVDSTRVQSRVGLDYPLGVVHGLEIVAWVAADLNQGATLSKPLLDYCAKFPEFRSVYLRPLYEAHAKSVGKQEVDDLQPDVDSRKSAPYWIVKKGYDPSQYEKEYSAQSQAMNNVLEQFLFAQLMKGYATTRDAKFLDDFVNSNYTIGAWNKRPEIVLNPIHKALAIIGTSVDYSNGGLNDRNALIVLNQLLEKYIKLSGSNKTMSLADAKTYVKSLESGLGMPFGSIRGIRLFADFMSKVKSETPLPTEVLLYLKKISRFQ